MTILGRLPDIRKHFENNGHFASAFDYFEKALSPDHQIYKRIEGLPLNAFEKVNLGNGIFAIEQKFNSKNREDCFFESHIKYIDIQLLITGAECMESCDIHKCSVDQKYDKEKDLITYNDIKITNKISLTPGDFAIFFPQDVHMGCQRQDSSVLCTKTVIKMPLKYF